MPAALFSFRRRAPLGMITGSFGAGVSMVAREDILRAIRGEIERHNQGVPPDRRLGLDSESPLYDRTSPLDSLGLVAIVIGVEEVLAARHGVTISLASEHALSRRNSPFRSANALADYACERVAGPDASAAAAGAADRDKPQ
jgi:D-alanine--poly(phosphoribitol) ligase subunit 2